MNRPKALGLIPRHRLEIQCVFPECDAHWIFIPDRTVHDTSNRLTADGWSYVSAVQNDGGLAWGWACPDPGKHLNFTKESASG
jgi:hypothetical protein